VLNSAIHGSPACKSVSMQLLAPGASDLVVWPHCAGNVTTVVIPRPAPWSIVTITV
jgi:hypothetical protein